MNKKLLFSVLAILVLVFSVIVFFAFNGQMFKPRTAEMELEDAASRISKKWNGRKASIQQDTLYVDDDAHKKFKKLGFHMEEKIHRLTLGLIYKNSSQNKKATEIYSLFDLMYYLYETGQLETMSGGCALL
jgi:ABC-type transporter MlaC component